MNDMMQKLMDDVKKIWYVPVAILCGIALMLTNTTSKESVAVSNGDQADAYVANMEQCVEEMLGNVEGARDSVVTITLADNGRREYVRENGDVLVVTDELGNQSAVIASENVPAIAGVTVACSGAGSVSVRDNIIQSVSTLLGIGTNKVCVVMIGG